MTEGAASIMCMLVLSRSRWGFSYSIASSCILSGESILKIESPVLYARSISQCGFILFNMLYGFRGDDY